MKNLLHIPSVKRFILVYLFSIFMILGYFIFKTIFYEEKKIEYKSFNINKDAPVKEEVYEQKEDRDLKLMILSESTNEP